MRIGEVARLASSEFRKNTDDLQTFDDDNYSSNLRVEATYRGKSVGECGEVANEDNEDILY